MMKPDRVCVGAIAGAFGVRGEVRLKSFCATAEDIATYGPLWSEDGTRRFDVTLTRPVNGGLGARLSGVQTKEQADALKGATLWADRAALPSLPDDEFYHADLIGLQVVDTGGATLGRVRAVFDHGAGDILEIRAGRASCCCPSPRPSCRPSIWPPDASSRTRRAATNEPAPVPRPLARHAQPETARPDGGTAGRRRLDRADRHPVPRGVPRHAGPVADRQGAGAGLVEPAHHRPARVRRGQAPQRRRHARGRRRGHGDAPRRDGRGAARRGRRPSRACRSSTCPRAAAR